MGLVCPVATLSSRTGPQRTILEITPNGELALAKWLSEPVAHVRDARSLLLLKLLFLTRRDADPSELLAAQRDQFSSHAAKLSAAADAAGGFDRALLVWRLQATTAAVRFTETMLSKPPVSD